MKFLGLLYAHVGAVLKALAQIFFVLGALSCIVAGIFIIVESKQEEMYGLYGLYLIIFGPIAAWVSSLPLFGFGELIERSVDTNEVINNLDEQLYNIANSVRAIERVACEENKD